MRTRQTLVLFLSIASLAACLDESVDPNAAAGLFGAKATAAPLPRRAVRDGLP